MNIEEILVNASPRPWKYGLYGGDSPRGLANSALSKLAVNAYERDQELIRVLTQALERMNANFARLLAGKPVRDASETIAEVDAALAKARERQ